VLADLRDGALRKIATRRGLVVPSLLADVRVEDETADEPPDETVLAAAAEIAELAEEADGAGGETDAGAGPGNGARSGDGDGGGGDAAPDDDALEVRS